MLKTKLVHKHTPRSVCEKPGKDRLWQEIGQERAGRPSTQGLHHSEQQKHHCCSESIDALLKGEKILPSMIWDRYLVFSCQYMEGRNSLKNPHEQRFFGTEHMCWTLKRSVIWSTEVQTSRLSIAFESTFCKVKITKHKVFVVNTYTFFQYFSAWDAATLTTISTIMVWVGFLWVWCFFVKRYQSFSG